MTIPYTFCFKMPFWHHVECYQIIALPPKHKAKQSMLIVAMIAAHAQIKWVQFQPPAGKGTKINVMDTKTSRGNKRVTGPSEHHTKTYTLKEEGKKILLTPINRKSKKNNFFLQITKPKLNWQSRNKRFPRGGGRGSFNNNITIDPLAILQTHHTYFSQTEKGQTKNYKMQEAMQKTQLLKARSKKSHCK